MQPPLSLSRRDEKEWNSIASELMVLDICCFVDLFVDC